MGADSRIRLLLLGTSTAGMNGSMARYARLVEQALRLQAQLPAGFDIRTLCLSLPVQIQRWVPGGLRNWLNHVWIMLSSKLRISRVPHDIIHLLDGSYGYVLNGLDGRTVTATVHDLIPLLQQRAGPGMFSPSVPARWIGKRSVRGLQRCRRLVADSENTRQDLVRLAGIDQDMITVVLVALDPRFGQAASRVVAQASANTPAETPVVLHVGHNGHYKNREGVIRIFAKLKAHGQARLVMAGPPPTAALRDMVKALHVEGDVVFVENPDDAHLFQLYQDAALFLFPSIYEGFGWPPLEAMALGCPVVCSTAASLPEVVGDAALTAPVDDEDELARLCLSVLNDRALADSMIEKGKQRASEFSIERMGAQLIEVYRHVLESNETL